MVMGRKAKDDPKKLRRLAAEGREALPRETVQPRGHRTFVAGEEGITEAGRTTGRKEPRDHAR
jgi:hypothetical protein